MVLNPAPGLVIKYDFLWKEEKDAGHEDGLKDRPCTIILTIKEREDGSREIVLCPITHSPPSEAEGGVEIPHAVSRHLGLDDDQSWIKTHQVNTLLWEKGRLPYGVTPVAPGERAYGNLPQSLARQAFKQVHARSRMQALQSVGRSGGRDQTKSR